MYITHLYIQAAFDTKQDLTPEEKSEKAITEACLARYQATLAKFVSLFFLSLIFFALKTHPPF